MTRTLIEYKMHALKSMWKRIVIGLSISILSIYGFVTNDYIGWLKLIFIDNYIMILISIGVLLGGLTLLSALFVIFDDGKYYDPM